MLCFCLLLHDYRHLFQYLLFGIIAGPVALRLGLSREDFIEDPSLKADNPAGAVV